MFVLVGGHNSDLCYFTIFVLKKKRLFVSFIHLIYLLTLLSCMH